MCNKENSKRVIVFDTQEVNTCRPVDPSTCRPVNPSTCQPVNRSTRRSIDLSIRRPLRRHQSLLWPVFSETMTSQLMCNKKKQLKSNRFCHSYTCQHVDLSTNRPVNPSTRRPVDPSTCQPVDLSTRRPISQSIHRPVNHSLRRHQALLWRRFFLKR